MSKDENDQLKAENLQKLKDKLKVKKGDSADLQDQIDYILEVLASKGIVEEE